MTKISVPERIAHLESYKPGKAVLNVFEGKGFSRTAILSSNENNLGTSPLARKAMVQALDQMFLYPEPGATALRVKLAEKIGRAPSEIMVGNGSDSILSILFRAFFDPGDELVSSWGTFVAVNVMTKLNDIPYRQVPMAPGYAFDLDAIAKAIGPKTKAVYLCNPNNPTGAMITQQALDRFLAQVPEHILVVIDEAYAEFATALSPEYPDTTRYRLPNLITLRTFSKAYGLAGVRLGFAVASEALIQTLIKVKLTFDPSLMAQAAGLGALEDDAFIEKTVQHHIEWLAYYHETFASMELNFVRSYGNFVMVDFGTEEKAMQVFQGLMDRGVFVRPLRFFQLPHCLRISVGTADECRLLVEKLKETLG